MANNVGFEHVDITGGFWERIQTRNREVTIPNVYDRFAETGRIRAMKHDWKPGMPDKPHIFWDSDVAKWMEGAAYSLAKHPDTALEAQVEAIIDLIEAGQDPCGYFNSYFQTVEPDKRFTIRGDHELYCAGHLIEAALAWYDTTGRDRFLRCMIRYADYIERVFRLEHSAGFTSPGHEEIELALVKLWKHTGEERYLKLAEYFLDRRGRDKSDPPSYEDGSMQVQDHLPVREQTEAVGHAVRAAYLYSALADVAKIRGDAELYALCRKLWKSITCRRMFITGGIGQTREGEAFTIDYDLRNGSAYAETCAAIGLAFFASRLSELEPRREYADVIERILYNGFLSSTNLRGDSFFYENPLELDQYNDRIIRAGIRRGGSPISERVRVFSCSCCPPNIVRFAAELGGYLYTEDGDTIYVNQYMDSCMTHDGVTVCQETDYPHDGRITLRARGLEERTLALRLPGWCGAYTLEVNGQSAEAPCEDGWLRIPGAEELEAVLTLEMPPVLISANPRVHEDNGRAALMRGPLVYCLESVDNGENLHDIALVPGAPFSPVWSEEFGAYCIETTGTRSVFADPDALYAPYTGERCETKLRFIPYYAFANRGANDMIVWVDVQK